MSEIKTIEVCTNNEYIGEYLLGADSVDLDNYRDAAGNHWHALVCNKLEDAGFQVVNARGQRMLFHGWHGTNTWSHHGRGWGTFDTLTDEQVELIDQVVDEAAVEMRKNPRYLIIDAVRDEEGALNPAGVQAADLCQ